MKGAIAKSDRINTAIVGATTEVATLQQVLSEAEKRATAERTERQELQALMKKHESLELDSKMQESELAAAIEDAKSAKAEAQKALQEVEAIKR